MDLKKCFKCGEAKPRTEFYRHPKMGDGLLGKCKDCTRSDVRRHRSANVDRARAYDRERFQEPARRMAMRQKVRNERARHPERDLARGRVHRAIRAGRLVKPDRCERCSVGGLIHGHHDDHAKPLDVMWLCPVCHAARHAELGRLAGRRMTA